MRVAIFQRYEFQDLRIDLSWEETMSFIPRQGEKIAPRGLPPRPIVEVTHFPDNLQLTLTTSSDIGKFIGSASTQIESFETGEWETRVYLEPIVMDNDLKDTPPWFRHQLVFGMVQASRVDFNCDGETLTNYEFLWPLIDRADFDAGPSKTEAVEVRKLERHGHSLRTDDILAYGLEYFSARKVLAKTRHAETLMTRLSDLAYSIYLHNVAENEHLSPWYLPRLHEIDKDPECNYNADSIHVSCFYNGWHFNQRHVVLFFGFVFPREEGWKGPFSRNGLTPISELRGYLDMLRRHT